MPRRALLTAVERAGLLAFPTDEVDWIRHYTLSEQDLSMVRQRRGDQNRLGFAIQLCYLRYPGCALPAEAQPPTPLLSMVARQVQIDPELWPKYGAVFFNRLGELRDRSFENQRYRASGLTLVVAAIVLWNTVYLERAIQGLRARGQVVDDSLLQHISPLGWEHINLTGDYVWLQSELVESGRFRPLRPLEIP